MKKILLLKIIVGLAILATAAWAVKVYILDDHYDNFEVDAASIKQLTMTVKLSSLEIHDEAVLKDSINGKWLVAKESVDGAVTIDLEQAEVTMQGDTAVITLPVEKVEVYESSEPDSYEIIDTYDTKGGFNDRKMTAAEENKLKQDYRKRIIDGIYKRGLVRRARANAVNTLTTLFGNMNLPVKVVDNTPEGTRR